MLPIYLASASPRRRVLLEQLGLKFTVMPTAIDETIRADIPSVEAVETLARRKAEATSRRLASGLVIGSDTLVFCKGKVLGKPAGSREAVDMLRELQDSWHSVCTGLAVIDAASGRTVATHMETLVKFKPLTEESIYSYVATGEPMDKAGAYAIQGLGAIFIEGIQGCYFNVVGLPLAALAEVLKRFGVDVMQPC